MIELTDMAVFVAVVERGSFSAAAGELKLSKPVVSKRVARLEDRLGARLLNRTTRRLSLTEAGATYFEKARHIVAQVEEVESAVSDFQVAPKGTLKVTTGMSFGTLHLGKLLPDFMARYPDLKVELSLNDRVVDLVEEGVDLAVRIGHLEDSSLMARRLAPAQVAICASPSYIAQYGRPMHPADLADHNCALYTYKRVMGEWKVIGPEGHVTAKVDGRLRTNNGDVILESLLAGQCVAALPTFIVGPYLCEGRLEKVLPGYEMDGGGVYAVYPPGRHVPAKVRLFIDYLAEAFGETPYWEG